MLRRLFVCAAMAAVALMTTGADAGHKGCCKVKYKKSKHCHSHCGAPVSHGCGAPVAYSCAAPVTSCAAPVSTCCAPVAATCAGPAYSNACVGSACGAVNSTTTTVAPPPPATNGAPPATDAPPPPAETK